MPPESSQRFLLSRAGGNEGAPPFRVHFHLSICYTVCLLDQAKLTIISSNVEKSMMNRNIHVVPLILEHPKLNMKYGTTEYINLVQIVYRLFLLHVPRLPSKPASNIGG